MPQSPEEEQNQVISTYLGTQSPSLALLKNKPPALLEDAECAESLSDVTKLFLCVLNK